MKDAAITRKIVFENLASWLCRKLLTLSRLALLFFQIAKYEQHVRSNGDVNKAMMKNATFDLFKKVNVLNIKIEMVKHKEKIHGTTMVTQ